MAYRPTETTRQHAAQKRTAFLRAATRLVAAHGFASAKVSAVARESGASTGSLYSYFDSREELLAEVFRQAAAHELNYVRAATQSAAPDPPRQVRALIRTFAGRALRGPQLAWSLLFEPVSVAIERERLLYRHAYVELGETVISAGIARGEFADQNATLAASATTGAISEALVGRLNPIGSDALHSMPDELILHGIETFCLRALGAQLVLTESGPPPNLAPLIAASHEERQ